MASLEPRSMVLVYDNYESDTCEGHGREKEDLNVHIISSPTLINEQMSPGISKPASILQSPVLATDIQPYVSSCKAEKVFYYQPSKFYHPFYDPIGEYMELHFLNVLNLSSFVIPSTLGGSLKNVINLLSQFYYLLLISGKVRKFSVMKLLGWLWWKFVFT
jgi:hypothetical protein